MRTRIVLLVALFLSIPIATPAQEPPSSAAPSADDRKKARERYDAGVRKFDVGRFDEAAADFEAAYQLTGAPEILYNMATTYRAAKKYDKALLMYRAYLRKVPDTTFRADVEKRIAELTPIVKQQEEEQRRLREEEERRQREQQRLQEEQAQQQQQQRQTPTAPEPPPPAPPKPLPKWVQPAGIAIGAVGIAGIGAVVALSVLAKNQSDTVASAAANHVVFDGSLHDTEARGKAYDAGAIACYVAGGVLAATGVALIVVARTRRAPVEQVAAAPFVSPAGGGGLSLAGRF